MQLRPVSADLLDESLCVEDDWGAREWQAKEGVGGGGGASGRQKHSLNDGTRAEKPAHTRPDDPSAPVYSRSTLTSPHCRPAPG